MIQVFRQFIEEQALYTAGQRVLLAVSGGVDSVVMSYLFKACAIPFGIAHCNFQLRGAEADLDEQLVEQLASQYQVPFFCIRFDTKKQAEKAGTSIQLIARQLRYEWLETIRQAEGFDRIATAHHLNDSIETLLYNLTKGCGIRGLQGIPAKRGAIIRPLLFATKSAILEVAKSQSLLYREDHTNRQTDYLRNKIRHEIIPVLQVINPGLEQTFAENIHRFQETAQLFQQQIDYWKTQLLSQTNPDQWRIDLARLKTLPAAQTLLYELLKPWDFSTTQIQNMLEAGPGAIFLAPAYRAVIHLEQLRIESLPTTPPAEKLLLIKDLEDLRRLPDQRLRVSAAGALFQLQLLPHPPASLRQPSETILLDPAQLHLPLVFRRWQEGDTFQPFGMQGHHKKLQDLFTDLKMDVFAKERIWVLTDQRHILWVVGIRASEVGRVRSNTSTVLRIQLLGA